MKFKCTCDTQETGFFNSKTEKTAGITEGKVYLGNLMDDSSVFIYDDNGNWDYYALEWFQPVE